LSFVRFVRRSVGLQVNPALVTRVRSNDERSGI
jgi:hypothetical protein